MPGLLHEVAQAFQDAGVDLGAIGLAWARAMPTVVLVPAFGLRALPQAARAVFALAMAGAIFPALAPLSEHPDGPWALMLVSEVVRGLPIAIAAAVPLWAATMAGGMIDNLRGAQDTLQVPVVEGRSSVLGVPFALLASAIFLGTGGPARIALALARAEVPVHPLQAAANDLAGGIALAVSVGGPLLAAALVIEVAGAVVARAASPAQVHALLAPLRALALLSVAAIVLDRIAALLAIAIKS